VNNEGGIGDNRLYLIIAIFILIVVFLAILWPSPNLSPAYVSDEFLADRWSEDLSERICDSQTYGFDKWCSLTYRINDSYPAYLSVTSFKTLIMISEDDLEFKTIESIMEKALLQGLIIDNETKVTGSRIISNGHKTKFVTFEGNDSSKNPIEKIKIIGEVWNCGTSGISIICIGFAYITDNAHNKTGFNFTNWKKIISDSIGSIEGFIEEDGLIFNITCH
jgi:hypothetical protein